MFKQYKAENGAERAAMKWAARTTGIWFLLVTLIETSLYFRPLDQKNAILHIAGSQYSSSLENWESIFLKISYTYNSWAYTQSILHPTSRTLAPTMFITALYIRARNCEQRRCPSAEWIKKKNQSIYRMEYCTAINNNDIMKFTSTWL